MQPCGRLARPGARRLLQSCVWPRCSRVRTSEAGRAGGRRCSGATSTTWTASATSRSTLWRTPLRRCRRARSVRAHARGLQARPTGCSRRVWQEGLAGWYARLAIQFGRPGHGSQRCRARFRLLGQPCRKLGQAALQSVHLATPSTHGRVAASMWSACVDSISGLGLGRRRWWRCCTRAASAGCPSWTPASRLTRATRPTRPAWRPASSSRRQPTRCPTPGRRAPAARRPPPQAGPGGCNLARRIGPHWAALRKHSQTYCDKLVTICLHSQTAAQVWPDAVHYPDFFNPATAVYWEAELRAFAQLAPWDGAPKTRSTLSAGHARRAYAGCSKVSWESRLLGQGSHGQQ
jgi:hypothetical protein